jgi:hypothetical protein
VKEGVENDRRSFICPLSVFHSRIEHPPLAPVSVPSVTLSTRVSELSTPVFSRAVVLVVLGSALPPTAACKTEIVLLACLSSPMSAHLAKRSLKRTTLAVKGHQKVIMDEQTRSREMGVAVEKGGGRKGRTMGSHERTINQSCYNARKTHFTMLR